MNNRPNNPKKSLNIVDLIAHIASDSAQPDKPFLIESDTFGQVYAMAEDIKKIFKKLGRTDQPVCLCTLNRGYVAAAMLASLTGGPTLVLPYAHTLQTLEEAQRSMGYQYALVDEELPLPPGVQPVRIQNPGPSRIIQSKLDFIEPNAPWLYLFTGGTTGTPKIWSKTPLNLLSEASYLADRFRITGNDKILSTAPSNHIYGLLYSVLLPLVSGASVSAEIPSYPGEIIQALEASKATVLVSLPAHYRTLNEHPINNHCLHTSFSSAGALSETDDRAFFNSTGVAIAEIYGSTETGGIAYRKRMAGQRSLTTFSCVDIKIDDEKLWVCSDFLSAELEKNPDGFYQTADRVKQDGHTGFQLLGRSDGIVKVGGKRVDLAKVQQTLKETPGVRDAYVFALPVKSGRENEILALVEGQLEEDHLRRLTDNRLEPYARPRRVRVVDQIPLSTSGKYKRKAIEKLFHFTSNTH